MEKLAQMENHHAKTITQLYSKLNEVQEQSQSLFDTLG
jgi:hypothetical protein